MRSLKVIFLALLFGGIGAVALIDGVAIGWGGSTLGRRSKGLTVAHTVDVATFR